MFILDNDDYGADVVYMKENLGDVPSSLISTLPESEDSHNAISSLSQLLKNSSSRTGVFCFCKTNLSDFVSKIDDHHTPSSRILLFVLNEDIKFTRRILFFYPQIKCQTITLAHARNQHRSLRGAKDGIVIYGNAPNQFPCILTNVLGYWAKNEISIFYNKTKTLDFGGHTFLVTMNEAEGFFDLEKKKEKLISASGIDYDLLVLMADKLNFIYNLTSPVDGAWGIKLENGSWNGLIGQVNRKEADFALAGITSSEERKEAVYFSDPYFYDPVRFVTNSPEIKSQITMLTRPFQSRVWVGLTITVAIGSATFCVLNAINRSLGADNRFNALWYIVGTFGNKANQRIPKYDSIRLFVSLWWLFIITTLAAYSGNLTSFVSIPQKDDPVDTLDLLFNLVMADKYACGTTVDTVYWMYMQESGSSAIRALGRKMVEKKYGVKDEDEGLLKVSQENYAFVAAEVTLTFYRRKRRIKNIIYSKSKLFDDEFAIAFQYGFPYVDEFNKIISRVINAGLIYKWMRDAFRKDWATFIFMETDLNSDIPLIGLGHLQGAVYMIITGYIAALGMFLLEISIHMYLRMRHRQGWTGCLKRTGKIPKLGNRPIHRHNKVYRY